MELRTLKYFFTLSQEGSISNAAKALGVTAPTLSRQLSTLEDELGRQLYTRSSKGVELTDHGVILAGYAATLLDLADKAVQEVMLPEKSVSGVVRLAVGDTQVVGLLGRAMRCVRERYPDISFDLYSGNTIDLMDNLVRGAYDFMLECEMKPHVELNTMLLPEKDQWGLVVRRDNPLSLCDHIGPTDLIGQPLITSRQGANVEPLRSWLSEVRDDLEIVATYNPPISGRFLVEEGLGSLFTYKGVVESSDSSDLVFIPLEPKIESVQGLVWRKIIPSKPAQVFLDCLVSLIQEDVS